MSASITSQPPPADPVLRDALAELVALGVRIARVAAAVAEVEDRVVALVAAGLRVGLDQAGSLDEARAAGLAVDAAEAALAQASARIGVAAQAFDRVSRAVRRTVALTHFHVVVTLDDLHAQESGRVFRSTPAPHRLHPEYQPNER